MYTSERQRNSKVSQEKKRPDLMIQSMSRSQSLFCCSFVLTFDFPIHSFILQPAFPHKGHNSFCSFFGVSKSLCFSLFVFFN